MEDYIDKVIYILIAVVISVVGAVSKANKRKKITTGTPKPSESTPILTDDLSSGKELLSEQRFTRLMREDIKYENLRTDEAGTKGNTPAGRKEQTPVEPVIYESDEENVEEDDNSDFLKDFNLQDAILYSEVLSRKY